MSEDLCVGLVCQVDHLPGLNHQIQEVHYEIYFIPWEIPKQSPSARHSEDRGGIRFDALSAPHLDSVSQLVEWSQESKPNQSRQHISKYTRNRHTQLFNVLHIVVQWC